MSVSWAGYALPPAILGTMLDLRGNQASFIDSNHESDDGPRLRATDWWLEGELRRVSAELDQTRRELETLRTTTAQIVTAILGSLPAASAPVAGVAPEIQELADLARVSDGTPPGELVDGESELMDHANELSLAYLDRRFRWVRPRRQAAQRQDELTLDREPDSETDQHEAGRPV